MIFKSIKLDRRSILIFLDLISTILMSIILSGILVSQLQQYNVSTEDFKTYDIHSCNTNIYEILENKELPVINKGFVRAGHIGNDIFDENGNIYLYFENKYSGLNSNLKDASVIKGRKFEETELEEGKNVAVISEKTYAQMFENREDILDMDIVFQGEVYRIIGVCENTYSYEQEIYDPYYMGIMIPARAAMKGKDIYIDIDMVCSEVLTESDKSVLRSFIGYYEMLISYGDRENADKVNTIIEYLLLISIMMALCILNVAILFDHLLKEDIKRYVLMKASGARNKDIFVKILMKIFTYLLISFAVAVCVYPLTMGIQKYFFIESIVNINVFIWVLLGYILIVFMMIYPVAKKISSRAIVDRRIWK